MGNTMGSSRGSFRSRITAGGAVTAAGVLAVGLFTAPPETPPTAAIVRATDVRTVQLAAATQPVMTPPEAALELSTIPVAGNGLPEAEAVVITPPTSRTTAPEATLDEGSPALWLLQPLYDFGQLLPVAWQQYYYVLFWSPVAIVVTLVITAVENTVKAVLGLFGISVPATAALTSEPSEPRTASAAATREAPGSESTPGNLASEETTSPGHDGDVEPTPTDTTHATQPTEPAEEAAAPTEVGDTLSTELDVEAEASMDADDPTADATAAETDEPSDSASTSETSEPESTEAKDESQSPDPAADEDDGSAADDSGSPDGDSADD